MQIKHGNINYFKQPIAEEVWNTKYRYRKTDKLYDNVIIDTWRRVANAVASAEPKKKRAYWRQQFYQLLENFRFLPGGRILAGAGTSNRVTLFNCYVMPIHEDSIPGIFSALHEAALTLQQGGGVGYDFSILRPHGISVSHSASIASGPVSFMRIWDSMAATIQSTGARRGAMMATLRIDHPDIEEFIAAKALPGQLQQFNVSVIVTDEFIQAVAKDQDWQLVFPIDNKKTKNKNVIMRRWSGNSKAVPCQLFRTVKARELWEKIIKSAYDYAEPGVIFEDTINRLNPLWYREWITTTNPCGEIPLPSYGACNLGSINLTYIVNSAFTAKASINWSELEITAALATRFLDNVITISKYPLLTQKKEALATRRIGLGFTGLADAFVMLGIRYGSPESIQLAKKITKTIAHATWRASIDLAKEKGPFPDFKKKQYLAGKFVKRLPVDIQKAIARYGVRNSHHNTIAPTGSTSLLANNISSGIEPIFAGKYQRKIRMAAGEPGQYEVMDYAWQLWLQLKSTSIQPPAWIDVQQLTPVEHLAMQAAVQYYLDHAIAKTINLPEDFPYEKLHEVYSKAYELGLKGCTIYRPNPIRRGILNLEKADRCCPTVK